MATETWHIKEAGQWMGTWTWISKDNDGLETFSVTQQLGPHVLTATVHLIRTGENFAARKFDVSDGNTCHYFGTILGNQVSATYFTLQQTGEYTFIATISQ